MFTVAYLRITFSLRLLRFLVTNGSEENGLGFSGLECSGSDEFNRVVALLLATARLLARETFSAIHMERTWRMIRVPFVCGQ